MAWEYRIIKAETEALYERALNAAGAEGWEAISGNYGAGESKKISLGHGMPATTQAGAPVWTAVLKRFRPTASPA